MSKAPYTVDNEKFHASLRRRLKLVQRGLLSIGSVRSADWLEKWAASAYKAHLKMPASKRPRFPSVVTSDTLFHYRHETLKRGLI